MGYYAYQISYIGHWSWKILNLESQGNMVRASLKSSNNEGKRENAGDGRNLPMIPSS